MDNWFLRKHILSDCKNNKKQKKSSALFGFIFELIFLNSDSFCLIASHMRNFDDILRRPSWYKDQEHHPVVHVMLRYLMVKLVTSVILESLGVWEVSASGPVTASWGGHLVCSSSSVDFAEPSHAGRQLGQDCRRKKWVVSISDILNDVNWFQKKCKTHSNLLYVKTIIEKPLLWPSLELPIPLYLMPYFSVIHPNFVVIHIIIIHSSLWVGLWVCISRLLENNTLHAAKPWWLGDAWFKLEFLSNFLAICSDIVLSCKFLYFSQNRSHIGLNQWMDGT